MKEEELEIGELVCVGVGLNFEVNKPRPGVVFKAMQGTYKDNVFNVGKGLEDHLLCWYSIEGEHVPPINAIKKAIYWNSFLTGTITNYVIIIGSEEVV